MGGGEGEVHVQTDALEELKRSEQNHMLRDFLFNSAPLPYASPKCLKMVSDLGGMAIITP